MTYSSPKTKGYMSKIPFIVISVLLWVGCVWHGFLSYIFIWIATFLYLGTMIFYVASVLRKDTRMFHKHIGWSWIVPAVGFSLIWVEDLYEIWDINLLLWSASIATILVWLWDKKDIGVDREGRSLALNILSILVMMFAIASFPAMINSSKICDFEFQNVKVIEKDIREWPVTYYDLFFEDERDVICSEYSASKNYYESVKVGDEIPVCIYTGLLGKKFYSFFEDPDSDFYGYNEWTREKYAEYLNETQ